MGFIGRHTRLHHRSGSIWTIRDERNQQIAVIARPENGTKWFVYQKPVKTQNFGNMPEYRFVDSFWSLSEGWEVVEDLYIQELTTDVEEIVSG